MKKMIVVTLGIVIVVGLCLGAYCLGRAAHVEVAITTSQQFSHWHGRLVHAIRVLQLDDAGDPEQLRQEAENELFYFFMGISDVVDNLDPGSSAYKALWSTLDILEKHVQDNPLKKHSTDKLLEEISELRKHAKS